MFFSTSKFRKLFFNDHLILLWLVQCKDYFWSIMNNEEDFRLLFRLSHSFPLQNLRKAFLIFSPVWYRRHGSYVGQLCFRVLDSYITKQHIFLFCLSQSCSSILFMQSPNLYKGFVGSVVQYSQYYIIQELMSSVPIFQVLDIERLQETSYSGLSPPVWPSLVSKPTS